MNLKQDEVTVSGYKMSLNGVEYELPRIGSFKFNVGLVVVYTEMPLEGCVPKFLCGDDCSLSY